MVLRECCAVLNSTVLFRHTVHCMENSIVYRAHRRHRSLCKAEATSLQWLNENTSVSVQSFTPAACSVGKQIKQFSY